jgi:hypothetical protein
MQRTLRRTMKGEDVRLLHAVLNFHLPPPSDQLPTSGDGASDFGPRTEEKVKEFQKINRIDIGTPDFMDGVVGAHTREVLESGAKVVLRLGLDPTELPPRPLPPPFPQPLPLPLPIPVLPKLKTPVVMPPTPQPAFIPAPRLRLDNVQVQAGGSHTINFTRKNTDAVFLQVQYTMLWKNPDEEHTEISVGGTHVFSVNGKEEGNDIQLFGQLTRVQIPIFDRVPQLTASAFVQITVQNLRLTNPIRPVVGIGVGAQVQWEFIKKRFSIAIQGMPFLNFLEENNQFKMLTGAQGQGFLIFQFAGGSR